MNIIKIFTFEFFPIILKQSLLVYYLIIVPPKRRIFQSLIFFAEHKIYTDITEQSNLEYINATNRSAIKLLKNTTNTSLILAICLSIYVLIPIYELVIEHHFQAPTPVLLPFTDPESIFGVLINTLNQTFVAWLIATGNFGVEIVNCILTNAVWATSLAICHSMNQLSSRIVSSKLSLGRSIEISLQNIITEVKDYNW